jgi:uncharacterized protein (TIGR00661 family)
MFSGKHKRVLVAALDWGMGHATRCVPLIRELQKNGTEVILASNGTAKEFFKQYFPELQVLEKPGYNISYYKNLSMTGSMVVQAPSIILAIIREHQWLKRLIKQHGITQVISDNCYGLWNKKIHSVFITHQLRIKCPPFIKFSEVLFQKMISAILNNYDECFIPDKPDLPNYSGSLSHLKNLPSHAKFIGTLSRFSDNKSSLKSESFDFVLLLSGPEPQRTILEEKFTQILRDQNFKSCIVRGLPGSTDKKINTGEITWHNHLPDDELKAVLKNAKKIICRPGYSTIMDFVELNLKALLIPTPGQTEQEYLAMHNNNSRQFKTIPQKKMDLKTLRSI